jgi:hypothetical protein
MKANYGSSTSMYVIPRDGRISQIPGNPATYVPNDVFVSDYSKASYPFLGADSSSIPIELGQRVGTGQMSLQTARELDPKISDPVLESVRVTSEGLEKALLAGIETQMSQGGLDPIVAARIEAAMRATPAAHLADVYVKVHEQMQKEQAAQQAQQPQQPALGAGPPGLPPGGPAAAAQPGAAVPPGGAGAGQPSVPPPAAGQQNLSDILSTLKPAGAA